MELPQSYKIKMQQLLKGEYGSYLKSFSEPRHLGIRVNTLKIAPDKLSTLFKKNLEAVPWCSSGFYYNDNFRPAKSPYYHAGLFYIQEPSAMSAVDALDIKPGDFVLDICAAPGGKSTQIGAALNSSGLLVSNDINAKRTKALVKNIELFGITNAIVLNENPLKLADKFPLFFDKILVDAPCSGEGMFRKDADAIKSWEEYKTVNCQIMQKDLLNAASKMLKVGGMLLYSTCTFDPGENEAIIQHFLNHNSHFELVPIGNNCLFDRGRPEWVSGGCDILSSCVRLWPHKLKGEGHFLALLHKKHDESQSQLQQVKYYKKAEYGLEYYYAFMRDYMNISIEGDVILYGNCLYKGGIDLSGIKVARPGWLIGEFKKKRFEPSQALAMGIKKEDAKYTIDFKADSDYVIKYLKGETLDLDGHDGWNLVIVDGFPLGWGKIQNGRLKNKYLTSWRLE